MAIKSPVSIASFTIEVDQSNNNDILLQSIPGCRLRSAIRPGRVRIDAKNGEEYVVKSPLDQLGHVPGMRLSVNPDKRTYRIFDPINDDPDLQIKLKHKFRQMQGSGIKGEIRGAPEIKSTLDVHRMKTLCRELLWLAESGDIKAVVGALPKMEDVEEMEGHFLLNAGSRTQNMQPQFEKDLPEWVTNLAASGG